MCDRSNPLLTRAPRIFIMKEQSPVPASYTLIKGVLFLIYWVAYQRGSFSVKERYHCHERARDRFGDLITEARYIRIVPAEDSEPLPHCFELPPAS